MFFYFITKKCIVIAPVKCYTDINEYYKEKEESYRKSSIERKVLPADLCEDNVKTLTLSSIIFNLLKVNHTNTVKLQRQSQNSSNCEHDSAFLLYSCARISAILNKFDSLVKQGKVGKTTLNFSISQIYLELLKVFFVQRLLSSITRSLPNRFQKYASA
jgi:arginyl-tRNA synthetase